MKFEKNPKYNTLALFALIVVAFAALLISLFTHADAVRAFFAKMARVLMPLLYAAILMLVLMPAVEFFEQKFLPLCTAQRMKKPEKKAGMFALIVTYTLLVVIVLLAVLIAYLVVRRRNALTNVVDILSMIPYIVPGTVLGIALLIGFNKPPLLISGTMLIMVVALIIRRLPYTIRSSVAILQQIPMSIEEAAISLGASKMKAFFRITVPMMASGIISGAILSWVTMISELSTAIILYTGKTKTLTVAIYTEVIRGNYGTAAALSTIMTILTVISLLAFSKLNGGKDISL